MKRVALFSSFRSALNLNFRGNFVIIIPKEFLAFYNAALRILP